MTQGEKFDGPIGARLGALVFSGMGTLWWLAASNGLTGAAAWAFLLVGVAAGVLTAVVVARGTRNAGPMNAPHIRRTYNRINLAQVGAIIAVVITCARTGRQELIAPVVAAVVGLHFLPFRRLFQWAGYAAVAAGFVVVALVGLAAALSTGDVGRSLLVTGTGCALVLWAGAWALRAAQPGTPTGDAAAGDAGSLSRTR